MSDTATVKLWTGYGADLDEDDPDREIDLVITKREDIPDYARDPPRRVYYATETHLVSDRIDHYQKYLIDVETDTDVILNVHVNDSYHDRDDWSKPIERGLTFPADNDYPPYECEMGGRIIMWCVEA